jgi:predicted ArsR family transcriptional regulator
MTTTDPDRIELDHRILRALATGRQSMIAFELAQALAAGHRAVVGRLQALKRRGMVAFERDAANPYGPGHWRIAEPGRRAIEPAASSLDAGRKGERA